MGFRHLPRPSSSQRHPARPISRNPWDGLGGTPCRGERSSPRDSYLEASSSCRPCSCRRATRWSCSTSSPDRPLFRKFSLFFLPSFPSLPPLKKWKSITEIKLKVTGYLGPRRLVRPRLQKEHLPIWDLAQSSGHYRPAGSTCVNMRRWLARVSTCSPAGTTYHRPR